MLRCGLVRTNWLLAMDFPLLSEDSRARTPGSPSAALSPHGRGPVSGPPSSAGPGQQEEGRLRSSATQCAPVKNAESTDASHAGAPGRQVPDRLCSETTRNMCITGETNAALGHGIPDGVRRSAGAAVAVS